MKHTSNDIYYIVFIRDTDLGHFSSLNSAKTYIMSNIDDLDLFSGNVRICKSVYGKLVNEKKIISSYKERLQFTKTIKL